jgi:hypothetical protein
MDQTIIDFVGFVIVVILKVNNMKFTKENLIKKAKKDLTKMKLNEEQLEPVLLMIDTFYILGTKDGMESMLERVDTRN